ncbi:HlyD family secretion protein [Methylocella sp.]|uniref:HlyD family secretion protein n=1 Tax=Methylocella sp. TaxID=1978226 RepID=UPI00378409BA
MTNEASHAASAPAAPAAAPAGPSAFGLFTTLAVFAGSLALAWLAWGYYLGTPWTRDGTVRVYTAQVAPQVSGEVTAVLVADNQQVRKGDLLFRIDDRDYVIAVRRAQAALAQAQAQLANAQAEAARRESLGDDAVSPESRQSFESRAAIAKAAYDGALVSLDDAKLNLGRTEVRSPVNGFVANLLLQAGTYALTGRAAMTLVDSDSYWVTAYFEETQLRRIRIGDAVEIILMGYPDQPIGGRVESLAHGVMDPNAAPGVAGLPSVNPVFTWVRLAQRIPVRVAIGARPAGVRLVAGMTATVRVLP